MYTPNTFSAWQFNQALPSLPTGTLSGPFVQAVFGVYQDLYPATSPEDYSFNYQVLGTYPCRALVVNMYHMGLFNVPFNPNDIEGVHKLPKSFYMKEQISLMSTLKIDPSIAITIAEMD
ncbi:hypothetical protein QNH98_01545 [Myroides sp. mNGS23_01]|nr:hypothetical protein [Myroides sp. mNGS23_01]WHT39417.1 hypothetical protein QNH98_01545 [Myroides sp. mNGS23_01]